MIRIDFPEPTTDEWRKWRKQCKEATRTLIKAVDRGEEPEIADIYKDQQSVYKRPDGHFHGKCAYCETSISANQPGDIEHFRPKGRVMTAGNKPVMLTHPDGTVEPHPGYYWLAYDWENLLPACADCNRPSRQKAADGSLLGKWDRFPVKGSRASSHADDLTLEDPLLINPVLEEPNVHLEVGEFGVLAGLSDRGRMCIDIFGLNDRDGLVDERRRAYTRVKATIGYAIAGLSSLGDASPAQGLKERLVSASVEIKEAKDGTMPYAASGRLALSQFPPLVFNILSMVEKELDEPKTSGC